MISNSEIYKIVTDQWRIFGGVDQFVTAMRCRLGAKPMLFWDVYAMSRAIESEESFSKDIVGWQDFDPMHANVSYVLLNDSYWETATARGSDLVTFFAFAKAAKPTEEPRQTHSWKRRSNI